MYQAGAVANKYILIFYDTKMIGQYYKGVLNDKFFNKKRKRHGHLKYGWKLNIKMASLKVQERQSQKSTKYWETMTRFFLD
jgi:hypothetical protein